MKKILHLFKKNSAAILLCVCMLCFNTSAFAQNAKYDELEALAKTIIETDYTIPSYTELKRRWKAAENDQNNNNLLDLFENAINNLKDKRVPYNIVMNINGDPRSQMGFNWYGNANITGGEVQIVKGTVTNHNTFNNTQPIIIPNITSAQHTNLNYNVCK
jgi:hypothetical protein